MKNILRNTTSAGGVVVNTDGHVLVVNQNGNSWSLPKGHINEGEDATEAAKREIYEESGVSDLAFVKKLGTYQRFRIGKDGGEDRGELKTISMFLFKTRQLNLNPQDTENPEARWVPKEDVAPLLTHQKDKAFFASIADDF